MRKKNLKKIYDYDSESDAFILDVQLENYHNAYSDWDFSPFTNRDLNEDLTDYLMECSYEIRLNHKITIKFFILNQDMDQLREERSIIGIHNYFNYQLRKIRNQSLRVLRDIVTFLIIGCILLVASTYLSKLESQSMLISILSQGLLIGGWVMIWEMFTAWLFDMKNLSRKRKHYYRLSCTPLLYQYGKKGEV